MVYSGSSYVDVGSIIIVLVTMFAIDAFAYLRKNGTYAIMAGVLGMYTLGWIFSRGNIITAVAFSSGSFSTQNSDPNLLAAVVAVVTIFSFLFLYFERYG